MKTAGKIIAVCAAAACAAGIAGCSKGDNHITFDSYWYIDSFEGIQPSALTGKEELVYDISFDKESASNSYYKVNYESTEENASSYFKTTFYATNFDWNDANLVHADYRKEGETEVVYVLETQLYVSGEFVYTASGADKDKSVEFENYVITKTYFRSARKKLAPVYSFQQVRTTTPSSLSPASAESMCTDLRYDYEVFYNYGCTEAQYIYTEYDVESGEKTDTQEHKVTGLAKTGYTLVDNNSLYTAVRGLSLSKDFSATISLFLPANKGKFNCSVSGTGTSELDKEKHAGIIKALTDAYGQPNTIPEENADEKKSYITYNSVEMTASGTLHGTSQTAWYAAVEDEDNNQYRATMLYLAVPLSYGLGTVEYTLSSITSNLDNPPLDIQ